MTPEDLQAWEGRLGFASRQAAEALGIPLWTYREYRQGTRRLPGWLPILCNYREQIGPLSFPPGFMEKEAS